MRLFVYPTGGQGENTTNPYINNMKKSLGDHFELIQPHYFVKIPRMLVFLLASTKADVYVFNWIENSASGRSGLRGALMSMIGLWIVKFRKAQIIWVYHNIHPHGGETVWSKRFKKFLFRNSNIIVCHSQEASEYVKKQSKRPVYFKNHPMIRVDYGEWKNEIQECDLFYWSSIAPYKGVPEFLENPLCKITGKKIIVIGKCENETIRKKLESLSGGNVIFENRQADFCEIAALCKKSKYVIFPYIGESISSSGVLMDTLLMGGTPVGPNRGAFADLAAQGCCITYNNVDDVFNLPIDNENRIKIDQEKVNNFINNNTWDAFGKWLYEKIVCV